MRTIPSTFLTANMRQSPTCRKGGKYGGFARRKQENWEACYTQFCYYCTLLNVEDCLFIVH